jgi:hypothetical protein
MSHIFGMDTIEIFTQGPSHTRYFAHNIAIQRYKDIDNFEPWVNAQQNSTKGMLGF